jgi:hypothetical protein
VLAIRRGDRARPDAATLPHATIRKAGPVELAIIRGEFARSSRTILGVFSAVATAIALATIVLIVFDT